MTRARYLAWLVAATVTLILVCGVAVTIGPATVSLAQVAGSIAAHIGLATEPVPILIDSIVWQLRLPRVLTAAGPMVTATPHTSINVTLAATSHARYRARVTRSGRLAG